MYYEIYIDVLFLENLMMDSLLLLSVRKILKLPVSCFRVFTGAIAGSALTCMVIVFHMPVILKYVISYVFTVLVMIVIGLKQRNIFQIVRSAVSLYVTAILYGGMIYFFCPHIRNISLFVGSAVVTCFIVNLFWKILYGFVKQHKNVCKVTIFTTKGTFELQALEDTGNKLTDSVTGDPVCMIDSETAKHILNLQSNEFDEKTSSMELLMEEKFRYITCRTIIGESLIPIVRIKKMVIHTEPEKEIMKPLIGICAVPISERHLYQMILNSDILGGTNHVSKNNSTTTI